MTELRKAPEISPHRHRHIGEVRLKADDGSFAVALADGRRAFVSAREVEASFFTFDVGDKSICSIMQSENVNGENGPLLGFDVFRFSETGAGALAKAWPQWYGAPAKPGPLA